MGTAHVENQLEFEETELRLGLPGGGIDKSGLKRGFSQTIDLKLNLTTTSSSSSSSYDVNSSENLQQVVKENQKNPKPPAKAQVVGWPPVRSFRKNILTVQKNSSDAPESDKVAGGVPTVFVKVSLDGAPYLRKVDLKMYSSYQQLSDALGKMFSSFTIGTCGPQGLKDFMSESKLIDLLNGSDYVPTYEDKDGDWMLVGDVPWQMFVDSCKRLRIMKSSEAIGLAPRAVQKCKNRC